MGTPSGERWKLGHRRLLALIAVGLIAVSGMYIGSFAHNRAPPGSRPTEVRGTSAGILPDLRETLGFSPTATGLLPATNEGQGSSMPSASQAKIPLKAPTEGRGVFSPGSDSGSTTGLWGRIFLDSNRTATLTASDWFIEEPGTGCTGPQLPLDASVTWSGPSSGSAVPNACDPYAYYLANLADGPYEVSISLPPGWASTSTNPLSVNVVAGGLSEASFGIAPNGSYGAGVVKMNASVTVEAPNWYPIIAYPFSVPSPFNFVGLAGSVTASAAAVYSMVEDLTSFRVGTDGHCPAAGTTWDSYSALYAQYPHELSESAFILKDPTPGTVSVQTQFIFPVKVPESGCIFILLNGGDLGYTDPVNLTSDIYLLYDRDPPPFPAPYLVGIGGEACCQFTTLAEAFADAYPLSVPLRFWALTGDVSSGEFWGGPWLSTFDFFVYPSCPPPPIGFSGPADYYSQIPTGAQQVLSLNLSATGVSAAQAAVTYRSGGVGLSSGECVVELFDTVASGSSVDQETQIEVLLQDATVPQAPSDLVALASGTHVNLTWGSPSDDGGFPIVHYNIYRGTAPSGESLLTSVGDVLDYSDASVTNGSKYYYAVSAVTSLGVGPRSNEAAAVVAAPLQATVSASPMTGVTPLTVSFTSLVTGGLTPYGYEWTFGDDGTSALPNASHTYVSPGTFTVSLTATAADGQTTTKMVQVTVHVPMKSGNSLVAIYLFASIAAGGLAGIAVWRWKRAHWKPRTR